MQTLNHEEIVLAAKENPRLKRLLEEHDKLEDEIAKIERNSVISAELEKQKVDLKKKKLLAVDKMQSILNEIQ